MVISSRDRALRGLREEQAWQRAAKLFPAVAEPEEALAAPGLVETVLALGGGIPWAEAGPTRAALLAALD
ncbi:hypothetical protein [Actinoplanes teichomyceticus]|uniref:Uncharacterized protein n=1 Tax=Actinoplanes teichomyceticus TaxID=1867 RepID=A0A561VKU2_ACTTI|nr:hypothetical protein [Actinoplanes teichomyceticus]TWG12221.1 hypothetical protein FHX34_10588 [Actinoplanes teichomyceticus]GIF14156.1 hypothetical protein Ate01nite_41880 [Actinoplanes teichomyceticus]